MVLVVLGTGANQLSFRLGSIIEWEEVKSRTVPRKLDLGATGSVETAVYVTKPRMLRLTARLNTTERNTLRSLQGEFAWQPLTDDGGTIDYFWIDSVEPRWRHVESYDYPWRTTIGLIASNV